MRTTSIGSSGPSSRSRSRSLGRATSSRLGRWSALSSVAVGSVRCWPTPRCRSRCRHDSGVLGRLGLRRASTADRAPRARSSARMALSSTLVMGASPVSTWSCRTRSSMASGSLADRNSASTLARSSARISFSSTRPPTARSPGFRPGSVIATSRSSHNHMHTDAVPRHPMHHFTPAGDSHPQPGGLGLGLGRARAVLKLRVGGRGPHTLGVPNDAPDRRRRDACGTRQNDASLSPAGSRSRFAVGSRAGCAAQRPKPNGLGSHWPFVSQMPSGRGGSDAAAQGTN